MQLAIEEIKLIKDKLNNITDINEYYDIRYKIIRILEGYKYKVYTDITGHKSIGIGFNLDSKNAKKEWDKVFNYKINFEDIKSGIITINDYQVKELFDYNITIREKELNIIYNNIWHKLKYNQRLCVEDMYFNSPKLINNKTNFYKNINLFFETENEYYMNIVIDEIKNKSNPTKNKGIQNRRDIEAEIMKGNI